MAKQMRADEKYVINLCDAILRDQASRQHRFDFLVGDSGRQLPVDAFYRNLALVIEFHERQHKEAVKLFDKRPTVSGVPRGEQRKIYDQRRRDLLPRHGIALVEFTVYDFPHDSRRRLLRRPNEDKRIIFERLRHYIKP